MAAPIDVLEEMRDQLRELPRRLADAMRFDREALRAGGAGGAGLGGVGPAAPNSPFGLMTRGLDATGFGGVAEAFRAGRKRIGSLRDVLDQKKKQGLSWFGLLGKAAGDYLRGGKPPPPPGPDPALAAYQEEREVGQMFGKIRKERQEAAAARRAALRAAPRPPPRPAMRPLPASAGYPVKGGMLLGGGTIAGPTRAPTAPPPPATTDDPGPSRLPSGPSRARRALPVPAPSALPAAAPPAPVGASAGSPAGPAADKATAALGQLKDSIDALKESIDDAASAERDAQQGQPDAGQGGVSHATTSSKQAGGDMNFARQADDRAKKI